VVPSTEITQLNKSILWGRGTKRSSSTYNHTNTLYIETSYTQNYTYM